MIILGSKYIEARQYSLSSVKIEEKARRRLD